ncbi:pancreatic progenitor cell differentiation and proliferation factor [Camelus ferus]|nr:pancreatic progenitor cell differentiation and proliferation factor [Camelus ferus]
MAAVPSSVSLVATHDYDRCGLGSTSRNSSCGSAEVRSTLGTPSPTPWVSTKPTRDTGGLASFSGSPLLTFMATVLESAENSESPQTSTSTITCDLAPEAMGKQQRGSQPGKTNSGSSS